MAKGWKMTSEQIERLSKAHLGQKAWNKGLIGFAPNEYFKKGHKTHPNTSRAVSLSNKNRIGEKHPLWKGSKVGYYALHAWISRNFGKANHCENCKEGSIFEWANLSGKYLRDKKDWEQLCVRCHRQKDKHPFFNPRSKAERKRMSLRTSGENNPFFGKTHSKETRLKISLFNMGNQYAKK